jgi:hypothetical protein
MIPTTKGVPVLPDRNAVSDVLRLEGYSAAWHLAAIDHSEEVFLVPRDELVPSELEAQVLRVMDVVPGRKVYIAPYREGLHADRLF